MAQIKFVVAYSENRVIGKENQMPWHLPNDFRHFKQLTLNHSVLMGRKTYESIGRPLPQREMWVLSRNPHFHSDYAKRIPSLEVFFPLKQDLYVIGGAEIYRLLLEKAALIYATEVKTVLTGDAFFPALPEAEWAEIERETHQQDEKHAFAYDFVTYTRKAKTSSSVK